MLAARALSSHPQRSPEQVKRAEAVVAPILARMTASLETINRPLILFAFVAFVVGGSLLVVAAFGLLGASSCAAAERCAGSAPCSSPPTAQRPAALRALARALVAWSPLIPWTFVATLIAGDSADHAADRCFCRRSFLAILVAGAVWAGAIRHAVSRTGSPGRGSCRAEQKSAS